MTNEEFLSLVASGDRAAVSAAVSAQPELVNARAANGASAIQWAMYHGRRDVADDLADAGADIDLATACTTGRGDKLEGEVNALSADGFPPVSLAAAFGHNEVVRLLLDRGADPNLMSTALGGVPPLQSAVFGRNLVAVRMLIQAGADVNGKQTGGFTALMGAAQNGDTEMLRYLLSQGADPTLTDGEGKSAADWAKDDEIRSVLQ